MSSKWRQNEVGHYTHRVGKDWVTIIPMPTGRYRCFWSQELQPFAIANGLAEAQQKCRERAAREGYSPEEVSHG